MRDLLPLGHSQSVKDTDQSLGTEESHQIVLQGNIKLGFTGISLTAGTTAQLVIDTTGLMPLRTDDLQASGCLCFLVQLNIRTTTCHVGGNGHSTMNSGVSNDLRLSLMEFCVQYIVRDTPLGESSAEILTGIDIDGTHQHRLPLGMSLLHRVNNGVYLLRLSLVYRILQILTDHGTVGGNLDDIHAIDLAEFIFLRKCGTCHTAFLLEQIKEILEGDGCQCLGLPLYLHLFLCLDGLMQTIGISSAGHDTPCKLIHDQYLIILHHIILIAEHQIMCAKSQDDIVLDLQILRIRIVLNVEEFLHLLHALCGKVDHLILLVNDEVPRLLLLHAHNGVQLGQILHILAPLQLAGQNITHFIERGGFTALTGNDQRGPGLIDQHGVDLVDDGIVQTAEHQLLLINHHIISQIIEAQFIIGHIGNVAIIGLLPLLLRHGV